MKTSRQMRVLAWLSAALVLASVLPARGEEPRWVVRGRAVVASDSPEASQIGADVLLAGGNAFDAAVATSFALTVSRPQSTGIGGGGFMVAWVAAEKRFVVLDFRESAPKAATPELYAKLAAEKPGGPSASIYGGNAVGVPGQLAGLVEINKRFGTQPLKELIRPAATLAEIGFAADAHYRNACKEALADYEKWPPLKHWHKALFKTLLNEGKLPKAGERIKRPDLAKALRLIAQEGPGVFYDGPIADAMVESVTAARGKLTLADLRAYRVIEREPIRVALGGYELVTMPPPSSGGVCLAETLNVLQCEIGDLGESLNALRSESRYAPLLVNAFRHAFADRARWLGDPDFAARRAADQPRLCVRAGAQGGAEAGGFRRQPIARGPRDVALLRGGRGRQHRHPHRDDQRHIRLADNRGAVRHHFE